MIEEGKTSKAAVLMTGIDFRTDEHYIRKCNENKESRLPFNAKKVISGRKLKLTEVQSQFLMDSGTNIRRLYSMK